MELLPKWILTKGRPGFYDSESGTAIEQTAKIYKAMNELITEYNYFVDITNTKITEFQEGIRKDHEAFETELRQEFQDFIDTIDLKIADIEKYLSDEISNLTTDLNNTLTSSIQALKTELNGNIQTAVNNLNSTIESLSERVNVNEIAISEIIEELTHLPSNPVLSGTTENPILIHELTPGDYRITSNSIVCFSEDNTQYEIIGDVTINISDKYTYYWKDEIGFATDTYNLTGNLFYGTTRITTNGDDKLYTYRISKINSLAYQTLPQPLTSTYEELSGTFELYKLVPGTYKILKSSSVCLVSGYNYYTTNDDIIINIGRHYTSAEGYERYDVSGYFSINTSKQTISYSTGMGTMEMMHYYTFGSGLPGQMREGMIQEKNSLQTSNIVAGENIEVTVEGNNVVISGSGGGSSGGSSYTTILDEDTNMLLPDSTTTISDRGTTLFWYSRSGSYGDITQTLSSCNDARLTLTVYWNNIGTTFQYRLNNYYIASNGVVYFKGTTAINTKNSTIKEAIVYVQIKASSISVDFEAFADQGQKLSRVKIECC